MHDRTSIFNRFNSRLSEFQDSYQWEETDALLRSFSFVGELIEIAFDPITAARGMHAMRLVTSTDPSKPVDWPRLLEETPADWASVWANLDAFDDSNWSPLMKAAHDLNAFAYFGILPTWPISHDDGSVIQASDIPTHVRSVIKRLNQFVELLPKSRYLYGVENIERTCLAASGRLKIDGNDPLTVHELAAVTEVSTKRLQNSMYARSADAPLANKDGLVTVAAAQRWLEAREYRPSIWLEFITSKGWEQDGSASTTHAAESKVGDFLFVPEARDGTVFSPVACKRGGQNGHSRYTIGVKDAEVDHEDFGKALAELSQMATPRWRRPNENGHFGIVNAERWRRLTREELYSM